MRNNNSTVAAESQSMKEYWNNRAAKYDSLFDRAPIRREMISVLKAKLPPRVSTVVDLGAGTGRLTEHLLARYPIAKFHLVDSSPKMLEQARNRFSVYGNVSFHEVSFESLPIASDSVDLVVSAFALHHVNNAGKLKTANEIWRVLRRGGLAIIGDEIIFDLELANNPSALMKRMNELFYPKENNTFITETFSGFEEWPTDPDTLTEIFQMAGFVVFIEPFNDIVGLISARKF